MALAQHIEPDRHFSVRLAREADVEAIFVVRLAVRENVLTMSELARLGVTPESFRELIRASADTWVAERDGAVVGFGSVDRQEGSVFALFVDPGSSGLGIGDAILSRLESSLFADCETIWLETGAESGAAQFYARRGWRVTAALADGDVRMEKSRSSFAGGPGASRR